MTHRPNPPEGEFVFRRSSMVPPTPELRRDGGTSGATAELLAELDRVAASGVAETITVSGRNETLTPEGAASLAELLRNRARADQAEGELAALRADRARTIQATRNDRDQQVAERARIIGLAGPLLGLRVAAVLRMDSAEIMLAVVKQASPELATSSPDAIAGAFEAIIGRQTEDPERLRSWLRGESQRADARGGTLAEASMAARDAMLRRQREASAPERKVGPATPVALAGDKSLAEIAKDAREAMIRRDHAASAPTPPLRDEGHDIEQYFGWTPPGGAR